jgi:hypothetical protein
VKFLNKKEQVIDIELTQYGKYLVSQGLWNPEFYEFFDDDILYDAEWAGSLDQFQNDIQERIKTTPRLEPQYVWEGIETNIKKNNEYIRRGGKTEDGEYKRINDLFVQPIPEKDFSVSAPLGTTDLQAEYKPAWDMKLYKGQISSSSNTLQHENYTNSKIPQIEMKPIRYQLTVRQGDPSITSPGETPSDLEFSQIEENRVNGGLTRPMPDGTYVEVKEDFFLLSMEEINAIFGEDNFEIEVYEVKQEVDRKEYIPLYFLPEKVEIQDDLLLDKPINAGIDEEIDKTYTDYFLDVLTDREIPDDVLCLLPEEMRNEYGVSCDFEDMENDIYNQGTKLDEDC